MKQTTSAGSVWPIGVLGPGGAGIGKFLSLRDRDTTGGCTHRRELVGGFKYFLFSPLPGQDFQFDQYFSKGLKPPTREEQTRRAEGNCNFNELSIRTRK